MSNQLKDLQRRRKLQDKANRAIDEEIKRITRNAKSIVSGDIESVSVEEKKAE